MYISTDDKNNDMIIKLLKFYPKSEIIDFGEIHTFQFASTCKHIILSNGSFSAIIGYLSFFSHVYYPEYISNKIWYGDMFSIDNWIKIRVNWVSCKMLFECWIKKYRHLPNYYTFYRSI